MLPFILFGSLLLLGRASASPTDVPAELQARAQCAADNLYRCFMKSIDLASAYCSTAVQVPAASTVVVGTVTPAV
jgi:hypothetical protein